MASPLSRERRAEIEREAWRIRMEQGLEHDEIGALLGVHGSTITRALHRREAKLEKEFVSLAASVKLEHTERLNGIARRALEQFEVLADDPRAHNLLGQARGAMLEIRRMWGLEAPAKAEVSGPGGGPLKVIVEYADAAARLDEDDPGDAAEAAPGAA